MKYNAVTQMTDDVNFTRVVDHRDNPVVSDMVKWGDFAVWAKDRYKTKAVTVDIHEDNHVMVHGLFDGDAALAHAEAMKDPHFAEMFKTIEFIEASRGGAPVEPDWLAKAVAAEKPRKKDKKK